MSAVALAPEPSLRPMRESDLPAVLVVEQSAYEFPWTLAIFRDCLRVGYHCWVYEGPHGLMRVASRHLLRHRTKGNALRTSIKPGTAS